MGDLKHFDWSNFSTTADYRRKLSKYVHDRLIINSSVAKSFDVNFDATKQYLIWISKDEEFLRMWFKRKSWSPMYCNAWCQLSPCIRSNQSIKLLIVIHSLFCLNRCIKAPARLSHFHPTPSFIPNSFQLSHFHIDFQLSLFHNSFPLSLFHTFTCLVLPHSLYKKLQRLRSNLPKFN